MRIIAGSARGRRFDAPEGRNTRPTLDRVKEAMFGMIQFDIENTQVLDLFSGSGSLGLEALSRGGAHCVFCDNDKKSIQVIKRNVEALGFGGRSEELNCGGRLNACSARIMHPSSRRFSLTSSFTARE